jgi:hypothetical protein
MDGLINPRMIKDYLLAIAEGKNIESVTTRIKDKNAEKTLHVRAQKVPSSTTNIWCVVLKLQNQP